MRTNMLVRVLGFPAILLHGDPQVVDRWLWLKRHLPKKDARELLDVGCGSGGFTFGAAKRGYRAIGLSWDEENNRRAEERARILHADAKFEVQDVRDLGARKDLKERFDVVICFENIEHIIDDKKLIGDIASVLKPGGKLYLTTPSVNYVPIDESDMGPFVEIEDGRHVRKGYSANALRALCQSAGLVVDEVGSCSGFVSQKMNRVQRVLSSHVHPLFAWVAILPFRPLPPVLDPIIRKLTDWPDYSVCVIATKTS